MATIALNKDNFEATVTGNDIVVIDFWADWCGPCKAFAPVFDRVSEKFTDVVFAKVDTDREQELAQAFQIRSIPTLMIFRESTILFMQPGMVPESALVDLVERVKQVDMEEVRKNRVPADQA
ncbi:Putative thioredoxin 2 [Candidatus Magnetaquicoccaceae bacterium FCR-1]|uniref:Thioredoxin n=1 Tax=Candidatus Magnetaquiglobus chichijimensis TaxID=3141448 RepID=A0ABQ0C643_9PROT